MAREESGGSDGTTDVAKSSQGDVMALRVLQLPDVTSYEHGEPLVDDAQALLDSVGRLTLGKGVSFTSVVKIGRSESDEIVSAAEEYRVGLILSSTCLGRNRSVDWGPLSVGGASATAGS